MKTITSFDTKDTVIGIEVKIQGTLESLNNLQINGTMTGELHAVGDVIIGDQGKIEGPVTGKNVLVAGEVHGPVYASEELEILPSGKIFGDVTAKKLSVHPGATFVGKSSMPDEPAAEQIVTPVSET